MEIQTHQQWCRNSLFDHTLTQEADGNRYGFLPQNIQRGVCSIIVEYDAPTTRILMQSSINLVKLPWSSILNGHDSGVFAMWHAENYMGLSHLKAELRANAGWQWGGFGADLAIPSPSPLETGRGFSVFNGARFPRRVSGIPHFQFPTQNNVKTYLFF